MVRGIIRLSILVTTLALFGLSALAAHGTGPSNLPAFHPAPTYIEYRF